MPRTWKVLPNGQEPVQVKVGNRYVEGTRVTWTDSAGVTDHVDVPNTEYKAAHVRALIQAKVDEHESVSNLTGGPSGG